jgi:hypothetical protein
VRGANVDLLIEGKDNYRLEGTNDMSQISRDPLELVRQCLSEHHYPDGFVLFCGTLFAPTQDRDTPGFGFTHKVGDVVTISSTRLGKLTNEVTFSKDAPAWEDRHWRLHAQPGRTRPDRGDLMLQAATQASRALATYPSLAGKRVIVTGGGSAIGAGVVEGFVPGRPCGLCRHSGG